jgi:hypothetical protein
MPKLEGDRFLNEHTLCRNQEKKSKHSLNKEDLNDYFGEAKTKVQNLH